VAVLKDIRFHPTVLTRADTYEDGFACNHTLSELGILEAGVGSTVISLHKV
jgi:hypothetical protein